MKSKVIILTQPTAWNFTDEQTGVFRTGNSAVCFLPFEGVAQSFSNIPAGAECGKCYTCELGFKQSKGANGKMSAGLVLNSVDLMSGRLINWEKICNG